MAELLQPTSDQIRDIIGLPESLLKLGPVHSIIETSSVLDLGPTADVMLSLDDTLDKIFVRKELDILGNFVQYTERTTPANPPANEGRFYAKDVGGLTKPMWLDSAGTETDLTAGGGGGEANLIASLGGGTVLTAAVPKSGVTLQTVSIATTAPITHSVTTDLLTFDINDLVNADISASAAIVTTKLADSTNFVLTNRANTFGVFAQRFPTTQLQLDNPAGTFQYIFATSAIITANKTVTLPLLTGNDIFVFEGFTQSLSNKTLVTPTIASLVNMNHDHSNAAGGGNLTNTALTSGVFSNITGIGALSQTLDLGTQILQFQNANTTIQSSIGKLLYDVAIGTDHRFRIDNIIEMQIFVDNIDIDAKYLEIESVASPGTTGFATTGRIFMDSGNSDHLSIIRNASVIDLESGGGSTLPVVDTTSIAKGSADVTKEVRFEVDGLTTGTVRVLTVPDKDITLVGTVDKLDAFAATTSAELASVISDETGSGALVFATSPTFVTPILGTPSSGTLDLGNITLTGSVAEFNTALQSETFAYLGIANAWGTINQNIAATGKWQEAGVNISPIGIHDIWIPAGSMTPTTTNGAESTTRELAENQPTLQLMAFDTATEQHAQFFWTPPRNWDRGTITYEVYWTASAGSGTFTCDLGARAYGNDDPLGVNIIGAEISVTDTLLAINDEHISPTSAALTVQGTLADAKQVIFQLSRPTTDSIANDVEVLGIFIHFTTDAAVAA